MPDNKKSDLVLYVENQKNRSFSDSPFNTTDGLVLAELAYIDWGGLGIEYPGDGEMTLKDAIDSLLQKNRISLSEDQRELLTAISASSRFGSMDISYYWEQRSTINDVNTCEKLEQFAAVTFTYIDENGNKQNYISYRGTDNTLEGWCEDFNMAYDTMTEAQRRSVEYLNFVASRIDDGSGIRLGGHSKGGNNAMYAFLFCDEKVRNRIQKMYNYDGPGMTKGICYIDEAGNRVQLDSEIYQRMLMLLSGSAICPYDSIIGQLLNETDYTFVNTDKGIFADHDPFSWKIDVNTGEFEIRDQSSFSKYLDEVLDEWMLSLPEENRKTFITAIWGWIYSIGVSSFDGVGTYFKENTIEAITSLISYIHNLPEGQRKQFIDSLSFLGVCFIDNFLEDKLPGYETVRNKIALELAEREISTPKELWSYIKKDPIRNTVDFLQSLVSDWDTLVALVKMEVTVTIVATLLSVVIILLQSALSLVLANLPIVAAVLAAIVVFALAVNFVKEHWDEFINALDNFKDYLQEKICEFAEAMRLAIAAGVNAAITTIVYRAQNIAEKYGSMIDETFDVLRQLGQYASRNIQQALKISNPLFYSAIRTAVGCTQEPVTIDMPRLQNAVDQMTRLASKVADIDSRLDSLYGRLCVDNIEQGEGIFTSLANLYHLSKADISVDEGNRIRRKAEAINNLFNGYEDAEKWALEQIGG